MFTRLLFSGEMRWIFAVPFLGGSAEDDADADADAFVDRRPRNLGAEAPARFNRSSVLSVICRRPPRRL